MKRFLAGLFAGLLLAVTTPVLAGIHGQFQGLDVVRMFVDGREVQGDTPAVILGGRTMVPVRFVSEALGATVNWNEANQEVSISAPPVIIKNPETLTKNGPQIEGSPEFVEETKGALQLLKDKAPEEYKLANGFLKKIVDRSNDPVLTSRVLKHAYAATWGNSGVVDMNWELVKEDSRKMGLSSHERRIFLAAILVHEADHVYTTHQNIFDALSPLEWEILAFARGRQALIKLNAPSKLLATSSLDYVVDSNYNGKFDR